MVSIYNLKDLKEIRTLIIDSFSVSEDMIKKNKTIMKRQKNQSIEFNFGYVSREMISLKGIEIILLVGRFKSTTLMDTKYLHLHVLS